MITVRPSSQRPRRTIKVGPIASPQLKERQLDLVAVRHIASHPEYTMIIESLRQGVSVPEIARYLAGEQQLTVTEKSFCMYLYIFRKREAALIRNHPEASNAIDQWVRGDQPGLDTDRELDRAVRFQKIRVGLGHKQELAIGMPMKIVNEDVKVLGQLIELKVKREGVKKLTQVASNIPLEKNVEATLKEVQRDQEDHTSLYKMAADLMESAASK